MIFTPFLGEKGLMCDSIVGQSSHDENILDPGKGYCFKHSVQQLVYGLY